MSTPSVVSPDAGPRVAEREATRSSNALSGRGGRGLEEMLVTGWGVEVEVAEVVGEDAGEEGVGEREAASLEVVGAVRGGLSMRVRPGAIFEALGMSCRIFRIDR